GTSLATVSRVLNGHQTVNAVVAARVLEVATELGYEKSTGNKLKQTIAVLVTWPSTSPSQTQRDSQYAMMFLHPIYVAAERLGYHLVFHFGTEEGKLSSFLRWEIATKQFEGAIIVGSYHAMERAYVKHLQAAGIPFFRLSKPPADFNGPQSYVAVDDYAGGYRAGEHLAKLGCQKVLHLAGPKDSRDALERRKGFLQACRDHGIKDDGIIIFQGDFHEPAGERCAEYLLRQNELPHGIFAANDMMAIGCMRTLQHGGVNVPKDVRIVGFDDIVLASYVEPSLTTIRVPFDDLARVATEELVAQIEYPMRKTAKVRLEGELVVRRSCGAVM
ncbi:MAG: LacI family transcriptional regulator, partial [Firmicutes bacterium]|nr:LacI family transcriptional regulator [Bacillota bacterium]